MIKHPIEFFKHFEIDARPQQVDVINAIHENWDKYQYFALSLPTGVGKTYIATSIADSVGKAYMLTSTLQLQDQYMKSWPTLINLKGRGNYSCGLNENFTVDAAPCSANPELYNECKRMARCPYINQKVAALASRAMITNPVFMLYSTHCGFAKDDESPWVERNAIIFDEAHNIENHLVSFAESDLDPEKYAQDFGVDTRGITFSGRPEEDYFKIAEIQELLMEKAEELNAKMESEFPKANLVGMTGKEWAKGFTAKTAEKVQKLNAKIYMLDKAIQPLKIFFNTHSTPEELTRRWIVSKSPDANVLKLSPIYGDFLFHEYFGKLGKKFVFLSATLGTKKEFCKELGIDEKECFFMETDSPFDANKSPVIVMPSIKLSKEVYDVNVKKVGGLIDDILKIHEDQRGIIHCVKGSTLINMSDGTLKQLSEIQEGDSVISWNEIEKQFEPETVSAVYDNGERSCIELRLDNDQVIVCTPDHKILTTNRGYVSAIELTESDDILDYEPFKNRRIQSQ